MSRRSNPPGGGSGQTPGGPWQRGVSYGIRTAPTPHNRQHFNLGPILLPGTKMPPTPYGRYQEQLRPASGRNPSQCRLPVQTEGYEAVEKELAAAVRAEEKASYPSEGREAVKAQVKCYSKMGNILFAQGEFAQAVEMYQKRVDVARQQVMAQLSTVLLEEAAGGGGTENEELHREVSVRAKAVFVRFCEPEIHSTDDNRLEWWLQGRLMLRWHKDHLQDPELPPRSLTEANYLKNQVREAEWERWARMAQIAEPVFFVPPSYWPQGTPSDDRYARNGFWSVSLLCQTLDAWRGSAGASQRLLRAMREYGMALGNAANAWSRVNDSRAQHMFKDCLAIATFSDDDATQYRALAGLKALPKP